MKLILEQYTNEICKMEITSDLVYVQQIQCNSSPGKAYINSVRNWYEKTSTGWVFFYLFILQSIF